MEEHGPWKTLTSNVVLDTPWIKVTHHNVVNPGDQLSTYSTVHFKKLAIGILPLDNDYNTWIVGQYRYPLKAYSWEIPEGGGDRDVDPLESAQRELLEETGIKAEEWTEIQTLHLSNSASDEYGIIYAAKGLSFHEANPDDDEELEVRKIPFDELYQMVEDKTITDSLTVVAVLKAKLLMSEGKL